MGCWLLGEERRMFSSTLNTTVTWVFCLLCSQSLLQAFFWAFCQGSRGSETPIAWVFGPISLSFPEILLEFSILWWKIVEFLSEVLQFLTNFEPKLKFCNKTGYILPANCIFEQLLSKTENFSWVFCTFFNEFWKNGLKTSGSLSFGDENTSCFWTWVFCTLSFSNTHKKILF